MLPLFLSRGLSRVGYQEFLESVCRKLPRRSTNPKANRQNVQTEIRQCRLLFQNKHDIPEN
jgi:hypothetical protein